MSRNNPEYQLCQAVSTYLKLRFPHVMFHFDLSGMNLSKAQAGMNKAIQKGRGFPDLFIMRIKTETKQIEPEYWEQKTFFGLFIELKAEGTKLYKRNGEFASEHFFEQWLYMDKLSKEGYKCSFACGFDQCKQIIDNYLKPF
jgi:hypothetical protein